MRIPSLPLASLLFMGAVLCRTEVLDRIAVSIGASVITESEILEEARVTAFLNGENPDLSPAARRKAADRMVERTLIEREMAFSHYPEPAPDEVDSELRDFVKKRFKGDEAAFRAALAAARLSEAELRKAVAEQLMTMQFIEVRFRPAVEITPREIQQYYERTFLPAWTKTNADRKPPPTLEESTQDIEKVLTELQVDRALDRWLGEMRRQTRILYRDEAFR